MEELIKILLKWFRPIVLVCGLSAVSSAIISLMLPEYYMSSVTFLTANPHIMDSKSLFSNESGENPTYLFGGTNDINRILALSESRALESYIIKKFNLFEHYDIDTTDAQRDYWVSESLDDHVSIVKTPKGMVNIEVIDKNPQFAADMANTIAERLDVLNKEIITEKKKDMLKLYAGKLAEREQTLTLLKDSMIRTIERNPDDTININVLGDLLESAVEKYNTLYTIDDQEKAALSQEYSTLYIFESAVPAVKRHKPVRSFIVIAATLLAFVAMSFMAIFIEKFKDFELG